MTDAVAGPGQPSSDIVAVPLRHPGRWVAIVVIGVLVAMGVHALVTNDRFQWSFMVHNMFRKPVLRGVLVTVELTVFSMVVGVALGIVIGTMRLSENFILRSAGWVYTWFFRAIPRYVLLTVLGTAGYLYPRLSVGVPFGSQLSGLFGSHAGLSIASVNANDFFRGFKVGLLGLALSEAAYMAEIVRAGILSIDPGQLEAASSVGMGRGLAMRRVILPQAMRVIIPPTGNETIAMLKDTSLVVAVPVSTELFFQLSAIGTRTFLPFPMFVAATLWYLALTSVLMVGQYFIERRFSRGFGVRSTRKPTATVVAAGVQH